jgi:type IV pilus assembly protein PilQ
MSKYKTPIITLLVAAAAWLWAGLAHAQAASQNAIEAFNVLSQGGNVIIRVTTKQALSAAPASFTVNQPARIAFDFPSTANALGRNSQEINEGELRSMSMVQVGDRTRLVLNLRNMVTYESQVQGNVLSVVLTPVAGAAARPSARAERFAEGTIDVKHSIRNVDFRRGKAGEGRVVVDLGDTTTGIDIRQQGQQLIVDFLRTQLPDNLRKRLDVQDFATPVSTISTFTQGDNVRMVIEPKGLWEHNAYQTDTQFVVEVKPVQYDPNKLVQGTRGGYRGEKLSLNFQNVDVRSVLNVIADFTDLNIITSDTVGGNLTLRLKDVPWDQALDIIMQTRGLDMRKNGNVIWIAPRDELATKEKLELEAAQQISELEPLRNETFQLNYTKAADLMVLLRGGGPRRRRRCHLHPVEARQRRGGCANQHAVRAGHPVAPRGGAPDDLHDRHPGPPSADRGAHRRGKRQVQPDARCAARIQQHRRQQGLRRATAVQRRRLGELDHPARGHPHRPGQPPGPAGEHDQPAGVAAGDGRASRSVLARPLQ